MEILISGAGIAGPTLAYWLRRSGHDIVLVEAAPALRSGGYIVDFWGLGYDIADRMGLIPEIRRLGYQIREVRFVDRRGRKNGGFAVDVFQRLTNGRFTSVRRSDIAATIYRALGDTVETMFGDSIRTIDDGGTRVGVTFERAAPREFDLVIGADGLHSRVRQLVFGNDRFEVSLGYHVAAFELQDYGPRDELVYVSHGLPGRQISRFSMRDGRTLLLFVFRDELMKRAEPADDEERKAILREVYAGAGWEWPLIAAAMDGVRGIYFDRVSQIRMDHWCRGRTALIGDAAACVSLLAGEGTGLAMTEAFVLAGELRECGGDVAAAFARYEQRLAPFLRKKQQSAAKFASSFAPKTAGGLMFRNVVSRLFGVPLVADHFVARDLRDDIALPAYGF